MKRFFPFLFFFLFTLPTFPQSVSEMQLDSGWQFRKVGEAEWLSAAVPGIIHSDLLINHHIPDPFFADNEKSLQWVDTCTWEYQTFFKCDETILKYHHALLQFDGLDTYANVFLNDSLILTADNMFRTWKVDCRRYLHAGKNTLHIVFAPAAAKGKAEAQKIPFTLPGDERVFTRKAAYHYGWDWGPRFVTCGVWRDVHLLAYDDAKIESVQVAQDMLSDSVALMTARIEVQAVHAGSFSVTAIDLTTGKYKAERTVKLTEGVNIVELRFKIQNPKRWWCNGMGDANLYRYLFSIGNGKTFFDSQDLQFGLRTIELVQEKDSIGKNFYFKLNGVPIFMKGANYIPPDNFLPRVTEERYTEIIQSAVDANMNMLRVWGGGVYEDDTFYRLCDEKGILVWQDFMFACAMYPGDSAFMKNVKEEVTDNVKRLRNHPCIALWCGNNEIDEGWHNWGWQRQYQYSKTDSTTIWNDYLKLFHQLIPDLISQYDSQRFYWESSPSIGWGHKESLQQGDSHYWGVWWGMEPFDVYKTKVGRFMSEYGFQGMPSLNTFKTFCEEKDLSLTSAAVKNHQKHPTGYETIEKYLERDFKQPKDFESTIYVSQLLQADGIRTAIEAHRRAKPYCMGTLYWQLNDCWPVTSWSSTDYYGNWKTLHYTVKKAYDNVLLSVTKENDSLKVYLISDAQTELNFDLKLSLIDFSGKKLWKRELPVASQPNSSKVCFAIPEKELPVSNKNETILAGRLFYNESVISESNFYFVSPKDLQLQKPDVKLNLVSVGGTSSMVQVETNTLAKNIFLDMPDCKNCFSDNYFDLLPNENKTIVIKGKTLSEEDLKKIKLMSLVDSY